MCTTSKIMVVQGGAVLRSELHHHHPPYNGVVWCSGAVQPERGGADLSGAVVKDRGRGGW